MEVGSVSETLCAARFSRETDLIVSHERGMIDWSWISIGHSCSRGGVFRSQRPRVNVLVVAGLVPDLVDIRRMLLKGRTRRW